jgi:hypothetical protein
VRGSVRVAARSVNDAPAQPASSAERQVAENEPAAGSKRVIIQTPPGAVAGGKELSQHLGEGSTVRSLGPNTYQAEKASGVTTEMIKKIQETFGTGTRVYKDEPQKLPTPPEK